MGIQTDFDNNANDHQDNPCSALSLIIAPRQKDLGGFSVNRILPFAKRRKVGPWVFFDHMGPADFAPGQGIDVRPHPHINLATVTYLFSGEIMHRDSVGSVAKVLPGDINLMVAGRGIVHSERTDPKLKASGQKLNGLQLWLALPKKDEEIDPAFYHYDKEEIPQTVIDNVEIRVMIGEAYGLKSPVKTFAKTLYTEVKLKAGQEITTPQAEELAAYIVAGQVAIENIEIKENHMAVFKNKSQSKITAIKDTILVFIGGESLEERHIFWNFVSSSKERIEKAKSDWQNQKFPIIEGDSEEFIPLPSQK